MPIINESTCAKCGEVYNPEFLGELHWINSNGEACYGLPELEGVWG